MRRYYFLAIALLLIAAPAAPSFAASVSVTIRDTTPLGDGTAVIDGGLRSDGGADGNIGNSYGTGSARLHPDIGWPGGKGPRHFIIRFEVSGVVPPGTVIDSATYGLLAEASGSAHNITDYKLSRVMNGMDWIEGIGAYPTANPGEVTWNSRKHAIALWQVAGASGAADVDLATSITYAITGGGWQTYNVTSWAQDWINGAWDNNGMVMWGGNDLAPGTSYYWARTSEEPVVDVRPYLTITWNDSAPLVTAPIGGVELNTQTPTVTWDSYTTGVINHQVVVCTADAATTSGDPANVYDSGTVAGNATSAVTGSLPIDTQLYAFAREETATGWTPWSPAGNGGFHIKIDPPAAPTVTDPAGTIATPKPFVIFMGDAHLRYVVRIFTSDVADPENAAFVVNSGVVESSGFLYTVTDVLADGSYFAFAKIGNAAGWSPWSTGQAFTVATGTATVDVMHMDEIKGGLSILDIDDPGPMNLPTSGDGVKHSLGMDVNGVIVNSWFEEACTVSLTTPLCGNVALEISDAGTGADSRVMRVHKIGSSTDYSLLDLDRGITFAFAVAALSQTGGDSAGASWRTANAILMDKDSLGETHFACLRTYPGGIGLICDDDRADDDSGSGWGAHWAGLSSSNDYRIIRLTGRNQVPGDYNSTLWKVYLDENPAPILQGAGTATGSVQDSGIIWQTDAIALGYGGKSSTWHGLFDWTAVNGGCDYAPGEWDPNGGGGAYASIGAAKAGGVEVRPVTISGSMVITKVVTHEDVNPTPPPDTITVQDGFYLQDVAAGGKSLAGVKILTSNTQGGAVAVGARVTAISGIMVEQTGGRVISNASVTIVGVATFAPVAMAQKALYGPCITQNLGSSSDTTSMMVRFFGKCTLNGFDPNWGSAGAYVFYIDDGSGAVDGREEGGTGIRCLYDASDPLFIPPDIGNYLMIEGIVSYEHAMTADIPPVDLGNVRTILFPSYTTLYIPPPP
ncbi:MAG: DNRLRE domain-containing protein [Armatimonadota bacterium]|nr:DNRLRE domain-containing protein [Armatimonadota bacterium]